MRILLVLLPLLLLVLDFRAAFSATDGRNQTAGQTMRQHATQAGPAEQEKKTAQYGNKDKTGGKREAGGKTRNGHLHGHSWAFGRSVDRAQPLWHEGVNAVHLQKRAVPQARKNAVNTTSGIEAALEQPKKKNGWNISVKTEKTHWREPLPEGNAAPDENLNLESLNRVRASTDIKASDELNISLGPELILKDERQTGYGMNSDQPDSALGMGMQFKLDF